MNLKFKKPSRETQMAMSKVAIGEDSQDYHSLAEEKLAGMNNHSYAKLVNSGNSAILAAMNSIDGAILIPDQGAWNGFKQIAKFLNKDLITVKTDKGLVNLDGLNESIISSSEENIIDLDDENNKSALFLTSFAQFVILPIRTIFLLWKMHQELLEIMRTDWQMVIIQTSLLDLLVLQR